MAPKKKPDIPGIRFKDKNGQTKYVINDYGQVLEVGKNGELKKMIKPQPDNKEKK